VTAYVPNAVSNRCMREALLSPLALASQPTCRENKIAVAESEAITVLFSSPWFLLRRRQLERPRELVTRRAPIQVGFSPYLGLLHDLWCDFHLIDKKQPLSRTRDEIFSNSRILDSLHTARNLAKMSKITILGAGYDLLPRYGGKHANQLYH
jgi:hypothetical protein